MSRSCRRLIPCALGLVLLAALAPAAQAQAPQGQTPKRHHHIVAHVVAQRHRGDIYVNRATRSYLDPGPSPDYDSDLYFEDSKQPEYLLGPGIFQRQLTSPGQYN